MQDILLSPCGFLFHRSCALNDQNGALHKAARTGNVSMIDHRIQVHRESPTSIDKQGINPLYAAVSLGNIECLEALMFHGANLETSDMIGNTPLHHATLMGQLTVIKRLIELGMKIDKQNHDGNTALHLAVLNNHCATTEYLLKLKALKSIKNKAGLTPLALAMHEQKWKAVKGFLLAGEEVILPSNNSPGAWGAALATKGLIATVLVEYLRTNAPWFKAKIGKRCPACLCTFNFKFSADRITPNGNEIDFHNASVIGAILESACCRTFIHRACHSSLSENVICPHCKKPFA